MEYGIGPRFSESVPQPLPADLTPLMQVGYYDNPNASPVHYTPEQAALALGLCGDRGGDEAVRWAGEHVLVGGLVQAAAVEAQKSSDPNLELVKAATATLRQALKQYEEQTGSPPERVPGAFLKNSRILFRLFDRDLLPKSSTGSRSSVPTPIPQIQPNSSVRNGERVQDERPETFGLDVETYRKLAEIIRRNPVTAIGFNGKTSKKGAHMRGGERSMNIAAYSQGFLTLTDPPGDTPMNIWISREVDQLGSIMTAEVDGAHAIPEGGLFTYHCPDQKRAWLVFGRSDRSGDVDSRGRPPGTHNLVYEISFPDDAPAEQNGAQQLESLILRNKAVFAAFIAIVSPGLDKSSDAMRGASGLSPVATREVTVLDWPTIAPVLHGYGPKPYHYDEFQRTWQSAVIKNSV